MKRYLLCLSLLGCSPRYSERCVFDRALQHQTFLECLERAQKVPSSVSASPNDSAEVVEECAKAAREIACVTKEKYCYDFCN